MTTTEPKACPSCGSYDFEYDAARGEYTCTCGRVLEENTQVSELTFNGSQQVQGKFGSQGGDYTQIKCLLGYSKNARELRKAKAYKLLEQLANKLNLNQYHIDAAKRLFNMAQERNFELGNDKNFTQGRPTSHVVAAALYITCRMEKTPHLLIDFSDALQINLYILGACYLKFVRYLHLDLPLIDPSLFIHRFCSKMEFGDKTQQVTATALRLLHRMKRDWMTYGRRPNSLCGAAILIAARFHGFKRTTNQIVHAVHACDETIRKRLEEFKKTSVAALTREEFERIDLEKDLKDELDPPSFKKAIDSEDYQKITNYEDELYQEAQIIENQLKLDQSEDDAQSQGSSDGNNSTQDVTEEHKVNLKSGDVLLKGKENSLSGSNGLTYNETLSDVDESEIEQFLLTPEESELKSMLWEHIHRDWIEEQSHKKALMPDKNKIQKKRNKKKKEIIDADDPVSALQFSEKLKHRINTNAVKDLFEDPIVKKVKVE